MNVDVIEPLEDPKDTTAKKPIHPHTMVRTDFKEQKLEKFFLENIKPKRNEELKLDVSLTEEEYDKKHQLFLKDVGNLEDKIIDKTVSDNLIMEVEDEDGTAFLIFL